MANDLYSPSTCKPNPSFSIYDLSFLCSFIFFSPYLLKFIFFISPLFFTTSFLILLSLIASTFPHSKLGILQTMLHKLRSKLNHVDEDEDEDEGDELFRDFEELEFYKIVFHDPLLLTVGDDAEDDKQPENAESEEETRLERLFEELDRFDDFTVPIEEAVGDKKVDESSYSLKLDPWRLDSDSSSSFASCESMNENKTRSYTEEVVQELQKLNKPVNISSCVKLKATEAMEMRGNVTQSRVREVIQKLEPVRKSISGEEQKTVQHSFSQRSNSWRLDSSSSFGSYGSMRKEKEWKRTLACKLFEERNNSSGGEEGMDSLWEAYEDDNASRKSRARKEPMNNQKKVMVKNKKKSEFKYFGDGEEEEEDDEEFMSNGQLCCLKALKLSTGKMNLGMGKPNLVKISKAIKGFGWLHHVGGKHGKRN